MDLQLFLLTAGAWTPVNGITSNGIFPGFFDLIVWDEPGLGN